MFYELYTLNLGDFFRIAEANPFLMYMMYLVMML